MAAKTLDKNKMALLASALDPMISTTPPLPPSLAYDDLTELVRNALADRKKVPEGLDVPATVKKFRKAHPDLASFYDEQALAEILGELVDLAPLLAVASNPALTETLFFHAHLKMRGAGEIWKALAWQRLYWLTNPVASGSLGLLTTVNNSFRIWRGDEPWNTLGLPGGPHADSASMLRYIFGDALEKMGFIDNYLDHFVWYSRRGTPDLSRPFLLTLSHHFSLKYWTGTDDVQLAIDATLRQVRETMRSAKTWQEKAMAMVAWGNVLENCVRQEPSLDELVKVLTFLEAFREEHGLKPFAWALGRVL